MTTKFDELIAKLKEILRVFRSQVYNSPNLRHMTNSYFMKSFPPELKEAYMEVRKQMESK